MTFDLNQEASVTFTYFVDEVTTTSGTSVRYSYFKQSSSYRNRAYDQAVYIDTITYNYSGGSLVGPARQVSFIRGDRQDWKDSSFGASGSSMGKDRVPRSGSRWPS